MDAAFKENILQTAVDISLAFNGESKEEPTLITNLTGLLHKTEKCAHCRLKEKPRASPDAVSISL